MSSTHTPIECIMLIDDNKIDNFFHERVIRKYDPEIAVIAKESAEEALVHLTDPSFLQPNIIFLDINMPRMNGWEFMEQYSKIAPAVKECMIVVMLTTSENPDDLAMARSHGILANFKSKPLTREMLSEVIACYKERYNFPAGNGAAE